MKIHDVVQGSPEWHALRAQHFCASEAPAMMSVSPYQSRDQLLHQKATGITPEVDPAAARRFEDGHAAEAAFRPIAERILGDELYPITGSCELQGLRLLASMDGLTLDYDKGYEHKLLNARTVDHMEKHDEPPLFHCWQLEHQMLVTGAECILFCCGDGTVEGTPTVRYTSRPERRQQLIAGWKQFAADLAQYTPTAATVAAAPKPAGRAPELLPALRIEVTGAVTASNLSEFKEFAAAVFKNINRDLQTDQDFADAETTVKWCGDVESRLKAAKEHALAQTTSIDALFRAIDEIAEEARRTRLELDRLVKHRKDTIRVEIVNTAMGQFQTHVQALNSRIGKPYMPQIATDFNGAIKGRRTVDTLRSAVNDELARAKISANEVADRIQINLNWLREHAAEHAALFADTATLVQKEPEAMQAIAKQRIAEHLAEQERKLAVERERIRIEEEAKARAQAEAKARAEQQAAVVAAAATAPAPSIVPAPAPAHAVMPLEPLTPPAPTDEQATLTLTQITSRLGFTVTADFLAQLGFPATQVKASKCYRPSDFWRICTAIVAHIERVRAADQYHAQAAE